jgi:hypothetical protein
MKTILWIYHSFGFKVACQFVWDFGNMSIKRLFRGKPIPNYAKYDVEYDWFLDEDGNTQPLEPLNEFEHLNVISFPDTLN